MTRRGYRSRLNRAPSPVRMSVVPWATVMAGSLITSLPIVTDYPILPPMGLLVLLAWRLIRPGFWPVWAAFPLGLFDDMFSGQPFGSATFLWSVAFIALELLDRRLSDRGYWIDWLVASVGIALVLIAGVLIVDFDRGFTRLEMLVPQLILSILVYPFVTRLIGAIDNWRVAT